MYNGRLTTSLTCRSGETGRHNGFRFRRVNRRGSNPLFGTIEKKFKIFQKVLQNLCTFALLCDII